MSQFTGVKCDMCGKTKGETNKWFVITPFPDSFEISAYPRKNLNMDALDLCGSECVSKKLSELLPGLHA